MENGEDLLDIKINGQTSNPFFDVFVMYAIGWPFAVCCRVLYM